MKERLNHYLKSILILTSGSMLGQIIGFLGSMFMTRLYTSAEIGIMTTVVSVTGIFAPVINGRFDFAVVKEQDQENVFALIKLSILFGIIASIIISFGSFIYFDTIDGFISPWISILFVFLILIIQVFSNVFKSYNNNIGDYKTMTSVIVLRRLAEETSMLIMGLVGTGSIGLLVSRVIGQYFGMNREVRNIKNHFLEVLKVKKQQIAKVFNIHKKQLYYSTPAALVNAGSYSLINLLIGKFYGLDNLGVYAISFAVLGLPLSIISSNVSKVYFSEASKEYAVSGNFYSSSKKTLRYMALFAVVLFFAMYFLFPILVPIIYGHKYMDAGFMIKILAPMFSIRFISSSLNTGLVISNKQKFELLVQSLFILIIVVMMFLCSSFQISIREFLIIISLSFSVVYLINLYFILSFSKSKN